MASPDLGIILLSERTEKGNIRRVRAVPYRAVHDDPLAYKVIFETGFWDGSVDGAAWQIDKTEIVDTIVDFLVK